jgi:tRNA A-37 threonylcarbamoyl transferase component Bud32
VGRPNSRRASNSGLSATRQRPTIVALAGLCAHCGVCWLGDAVGLVQEYVPGQNLDDALREGSEIGSDAAKGLQFIKVLIATVLALHERGAAHGDLKPENIILEGSEYRPVLIDLIDFASSDEGERISSAYSPMIGGTFERDRYAITKIAEDVLRDWLRTRAGSDVTEAIKACRENVPQNGTLLPLIEAIDGALSPPVVATRPRLALSIVKAQTGPVLDDEGKIYLRKALDRDRQVIGFILRGACEEVEVRVDANNRPLWASRRDIDQGKIRPMSKYERPLEVDLVIERSDINAFNALREFMEG